MKSSKMTSCLLISFLVLSVSSFDCSQKKGLVLADDGYHWPEMTLTSKFYSEWWYFTFYSVELDVGGIVKVRVFNPKNDEGDGYSDLQVTVFEPNNIQFKFGEKYSISDLKANEANASSIFPDGSIEVLSDDQYRINISTKNHSFRLDISIEKAPEVEGIIQRPAGVEPIAYFGYVSYMPIAKVNGLMSVDGNDYKLVDSISFHDHQYGTWYNYLVNNVGWGQFGDFEKNFALVWGFFRVISDDYAGFLFLRFGEGSVSEMIGTECLNEFKIQVNQTRKGPGGMKYASKYTLLAHNSKYRVEISLEAHRVFFKKFQEEEEEEIRTSSNNNNNNKDEKKSMDNDIDFIVISKCHAKVFENENLLVESSGYGFNDWPASILS